MTSPLYDLDSYAWHSVGTETAAPFIGSTNTPLIVGSGGDAVVACDTTFYVRLLIQEYNNKADNSVGFKLQYNKNSTGWNDVTASSSNVKIVGAVSIADHATTTQRLGSGTFVGSNQYCDDVDGSTGTSNFAGNDETNTLHVIRVIDTDVADTDSIELRVLVDFTTAPTTTTNAPTITISKGAAYNLTVDPGTYSLTGTDPTPKAGRKISIAPGVYSQAGTIVDLLRGFRIAIAPGVYTYAGTDVTLTHAAAYPYEFDLEEGDLSEWDTSTGSVSAAAGAALASTNYGLQIVVASGDTSTDYVTAAIPAPSSDKLRVRVYFDPNTFNYTAGEVSQIVHITTSGGGQSNAFNLMWRFGEGNYQVAVWARQDISTYKYSGYVTVTDAPHYIEFNCVRESTDGAANGTVDWWIDGTEQTSYNITGIENFNAFNGIDGVDMGMTYRNVGTFYGTFYMDELVINDTGVEIGPLGTAYNLVCAPGVYTYTGTDAAIKAGRKLPITPGVYSHTGTDPSLKVGRRLAIAPGVYTYAGTDIGLLRGLLLAITPGVYTYAGTDVTLVYGDMEVITIDPGVYTYSGTDVNLKVGRKLAVVPGVYTYSGTDVTLIYGGMKILGVDPGVYTYAGTDVNLKVGRKLSITPAAYTLTGTDINLLKGLLLSLDPGVYTYTGLDVNLLRGFYLAADSGVYTYAGTPIQLFLARLLHLDPGVYTYTGSTVLLNYSAIIFVTPYSRTFVISAEDRTTDILDEDRQYNIAEGEDK